MRKCITGAALIAAISTAQAVEVTETQITAALAEWMIAHCGPEKVPSSTALWLQVIVNGSEPGEMEEARQRVRAKITSGIKDRDAACIDLTKHFGGAATQSKEP